MEFTGEPSLTVISPHFAAGVNNSLYPVNNIKYDLNTKPIPPTLAFGHLVSMQISLVTPYMLGFWL